jgi:tetratricopeptide (TPR) repeat protein
MAGVIILFLVKILNIRFIQDDAYTTFRYVKNFIEGNGLVFNVGERVEGYTNFLWVMILSIPMYLSRIFSMNLEIETIAQIFSILLCVIVILETYYLSRLMKSNRDNHMSIFLGLLNETSNFLPPFLMVVSIPFLYWGVSAMETSLFVALTLLSLILYLKNISSKQPGKIFVMVSVLNSLTRPEGMIFFILIMGHQILTNYLAVNEHNLFAKLRKTFNSKILKELVYYSIPVAIYICFRLLYYGYPFPNTFYAKTDFSFKFLIRGWIYFWEFARPFLAYGLFLFLPLAMWKEKGTRIKFSTLYGIFICWIVIVIILGGDVLPINRFFLPILPMIYVLIAKSLICIVDIVFAKNKRVNSFGKIIVYAFVIIWGIYNYNVQYDNMMTKRAYESGLVKKMKIYASWVNHQIELNNRGMSVAMSTIGAFSYYSNARVIDLVGLTDEYVAHYPKEVKGIDDDLPVLWKERHYNAEYILSKKPDFIIFPAGAKPSAFAECAVFVQPEFKNKYFTSIFYSEKLDQLLPIFTRNNKSNDAQSTNEFACDVKFLKHYIMANNLFLMMLEKNVRTFLEKVITECDSIISFCPFRYNDAITIKGYANYHAGLLDEAEKYLSEASKNDPANSIARYYLKDIYIQKEKTADAVRTMIEIKKYSPDALPYFDNPK